MKRILSIDGGGIKGVFPILSGDAGRRSGSGLRHILI
jgi:hypothetical protein